jgi:hypothetical protein
MCMQEPINLNFDVLAHLADRDDAANGIASLHVQVSKSEESVAS